MPLKYNNLMNTSSIFRILSCMLSLSGSLFSQVDPEHTEIRFMGWESSQEGLFTLDETGNYAAISVPAYKFGSSVFISDNQPLKIFQRFLEEGEWVYQVVGETRFPEGCKIAQAYLARSADIGELRQYKVIALSNDLKDFPNGQVRIFNFAPYEAMIKAEGKVMRISALDWILLDVTPDRKHRVSIMATLDVSGDWTRSVRDMVTMRENYRGEITLLYTQVSFDETAPDSPVNQSRMFTLSSSEYVHPKTFELPIR